MFLSSGKHLIKFQNEDGGFGHGIEPDFRLPASSPMATTLGLQCLVDIQCPIDHEVFTNAIKYLVNEYDQERVGWWTIPPQVTEYPHAPWWATNPKKREQCMVEWINPCAEIVGYLHAAKHQVPKSLLHAVTRKLVDQLNTSDEPFEQHDLLCYARTLNFLPTAERQLVLSKINSCLIQVVEMNPEKWGDYCLPPHWLVDHPSSPFYDDLHEVINANLNWIINTQQEDGSWPTSWSWGQFESDWSKAKIEWQGHLTFKYLKILKAFGRIRDTP